MHTCLWPCPGMQFLGALDAYLPLALPWYAVPGCSGCIPASGLALVCSSWVLWMHTCLWPCPGMQLLGALSAYLLTALLWYEAIGCERCIFISQRVVTVRNPLLRD